MEEDMPEATSILDDRRNRGVGEYGCAHYRRRAKLVAPCCGEVFACRHCHNEAKNANEEDPKKRHEIDRKAVTEVVCFLCNTRQPVAECCAHCGVAFGAYTCLQCRFFDDEGIDKDIYHCDECGICRIGGRDNFFHCKTCGSCYAASLRDNHVCVERAMHQNCPVCFEYLFESTEPTTVLKCGHTIHSNCLQELEQNTSNICPCCPICKKSLGDYSEYWRILDQEVENAPVPEEYSGWKVDIFCNDCACTSLVDFNLIALKCSSCGSYNTRRSRIITPDGVTRDAH